MKTDYEGTHDLAYQVRRRDPEYSGWGKGEGSEDWQITWQPLLQKAIFPKQGKLLELGCGAGNIGIDFARKGYEVTGIDISSVAIAWAMEKVEKADIKVQLIHGDVRSLSGISDDTFDIALDGRCFHCIIGNTDRTQFLQSARRVLKVGGILAICTMCNPSSQAITLHQNFDLKSRCLMYNDIAVRYIGDSNEILQEVILAGFRVLSMELIRPQYPEDFADLQLIAEKI